MICLTPFACRSGQTSSMLGGAQFKATLLDQKALFSNIQCKMTDSNSWQTRVVGKQLPAASDINRGLPLPAHSSAQRPLWAENAALQEVNQFHKAPELSVYARKLVFLWSLKPKSTPYAYTAQRHPLDFPHTMVEHRSWTPSELVKFLKFLKGKIKEHLPKGWAMDLEVLEPHKWSLPYEQYRTFASTRVNPSWQGTLVVACSSQRSGNISLFSVAENWAPLIFSCSHNQSNPFNLSNLHHKSYIWTQTEKKIIFTKFVQYTHLIFYGTHCTRRKRAMALKQVYLSSAVTTNEDSWKPVFSVLLEHRAFLMAPAKDHRLLFPSGAMMLHLISPDFRLVSF